MWLWSIHSFPRVQKQAAQLTLRVQRAFAEILKGNPKYMEASLAQGHAHFSCGCGFMMGLETQAAYQIWNP